MIALITFVFVMVVTAILFGSWVVLTVAKLIWRSINGQSPSMPPLQGRQCINIGCRAGNPMHAHYCRRCGANLIEVAAPRRAMNAPQPRFNPTSGRGDRSPILR